MADQKAPILKPGTIVGNWYEVLFQLEPYKELFKCRDLRNSGHELVLKLEVINENNTNRLQTEWQLYKRLSSSKCFDFVVDFISDDKFRYLILKCLGQNLHEFRKKKLKQQNWSLENVVDFAEQMIARVANCHIRGIVHRDIKPENFVVDENDFNYLYLIDFNLGNVFSSSLGSHIPFRTRSPSHSVGNVQFLSTNAHRGEEQSRRDDMISICYTLIFLAKGCLPWSRLRSKDFESRFDYLKAVAKIKLNCSVQELCDGLPVQFKQFMDYCLALKFEEKPDYIGYRQLFLNLKQQIKTSDVTLVKCQTDDKTETKSRSAVTREDNSKPKKLTEFYKNYSISSPPMKCP